MKPTVLITGGAGFIGSATAAALYKSGYKIRILDNLGPPVHDGRWPKWLPKNDYELLRGDVRQKSDLEKALRGANFVYHLAAYQDQRPDFSKFFETNTVSTALLYEIITERKLPVKKIILASSQFVYGDGRYVCAHSKKDYYPELRRLSDFQRKKFDVVCLHGGRAEFQPFREDQAPNPTNSYGLSKEALERASLRFGKTYKIPTTVLRYSIVQGPGQSPLNMYSGALRIFAVQALQKKPLTVYEDGRQLRDFVNIEDVVAANVLVLKNKKSDFEIYNVGGGRAYTILEFAEMAIKITNTPFLIKIGGFRRTDTRHAVSDISKLKKLGWRPRYSPEKSIKDYLDWYKIHF